MVHLTRSNIYIFQERQDCAERFAAVCREAKQQDHLALEDAGAMGAPVVPAGVPQKPSAGRQVMQAVQRAGVACAWKALQVRKLVGC